MVAVIRWCYLGTGRCVWHNLKLEIAVSISPHSVATRSTDNKSSLILLKTSRECSGGWDEERREGEKRGERGRRRRRVSDGRRQEAKRGRENREESLATGKAPPRKKTTTLSLKVLAGGESFASLQSYLSIPSAHHLSQPLYLLKSAPSIYLTTHLSIYRSIHLPALITPHRLLFSFRTVLPFSPRLIFILPHSPSSSLSARQIHALSCFPAPG